MRNKIVNDITFDKQIIIMRIFLEILLIGKLIFKLEVLISKIACYNIADELEGYFPGSPTTWMFRAKLYC